MDTEEEPAFIIHLPNGNNLKFKEVQSGLYLYDYKNPKYLRENVEYDYSFLIQSRSGEHNFSRLEVNRAEQARDLHDRLGYKS